MACLNMSSNDHALYSTNAGPRISFSSDFLEPVKLEKSYREAPVSSDFEFSVRNYSMISADEVFFDGKMLPSRESFTKAKTLRDELLSSDDGCEDVSLRRAKGTSRWRERFGLKRTPKGLGSIDEMKASEMGVFGRKK
ncbi:hypothetical protein SASPL_122393 [Salvia splendens]|uniref:Uncharacterized protein n=1 Tax=Salvia splendens TaxID=180675 RepID=A0A8X8XLA3_SALSN|nr:uncharacterized protein LOC121744670 [Salvia splendens]KAG6414994.1 hypothetical protein SASPL_122393 [Salvia splendens]